MTLTRIGLLAGLMADLRRFGRATRLECPKSGEPVLLVRAPLSGAWFAVLVTRDAQDRWLFGWRDRLQVADDSAMAAARIAEVVR
ncbi:hypothetical protein AB0L06_30165 [Spirillospora sp. NPDC052269]